MLEGRNYKTKVDIECFGLSPEGESSERFDFKAGTLMEFMGYGDPKQFVDKPTRDMIVCFLKHSETDKHVRFLTAGKNLAALQAQYKWTSQADQRRKRQTMERHIDMTEYFSLVNNGEHDDDTSY